MTSSLTADTALKPGPRAIQQQRGATFGVRHPQPRVLVVPGLRNSGDGHWQTHWQRAHPEYRRVEQRDWNNPDLETWSAEVERALNADDTPAIIVAHSFGCLAAMHAVTRARGRIAAAFLVAPANPARFGVDQDIAAIAPLFPSVLVASTNDPWLPFEKAVALARQWGSNLVNIGDGGHINADSGHGAWPEGERLLYELQRRIGSAARARA
ncbi:MAG: alpha/beta fold hydrolase [Betaproteobacteria bacterium]